MKVHKITNPVWLGVIAPLIQKFYSRVKDSSGMYEGITYESLYTYLARLIQFGKGKNADVSEVWIAYDEKGNAVGFAAWQVMDIPHVGKVFCPCLYNDTRNQKAIRGLYEEFKQFGLRHRAPIYQFYAVNDKVGDYFASVAGKLGVEFKETGLREYIGRKV